MSKEMELNNCYKEKCKSYMEEISKDEALQSKLLKNLPGLDSKKAEKIGIEIYKNPNFKLFTLCRYNSCKSKFYIKIKELYKSFQYHIKLYDIKLNAHLAKLNNEFGTLLNKKKLNEEEIIRLFIIINIIKNEEVNIIFNNHFAKLSFKLFKCTKKCDDLSKIMIQNKDLFDLRLKMILEKDIIKKYKLIEDITLHPAQLNLEKCITHKCNKIYFEVFKKGLELNIKKIKLNKLKVPEIIKKEIDYLTSLKKLSEENLAKVSIAAQKISSFIDSKT